MIAVPYPIPAGEFTLLVSDWYKTSHKVCNSKIISHFTFSFNSIFFLSLDVVRSKENAVLLYSMTCYVVGVVYIYRLVT